MTRSRVHFAACIDPVVFFLSVKCGSPASYSSILNRHVNYGLPTL